MIRAILKHPGEFIAFGMLCVVILAAQYVFS